MKEANYTLLEAAFFLAVFGEVFTVSFAIWDLILAALFLWITFLLAARSASETALRTSLVFLVFFASLIAASSLLMVSLLTTSLARLPLRALLAVFVTGIIFQIIRKLGQLRVSDGQILRAFWFSEYSEYSDSLTQ